MKNLELTQMEHLSGGSTNCLVRGMGVTLSVIAGFAVPVFWGAATAILFTSGDCFNE